MNLFNNLGDLLDVFLKNSEAYQLNIRPKNGIGLILILWFISNLLIQPTL